MRRHLLRAAALEKKHISAIKQVLDEKHAFVIGASALALTERCAAGQESCDPLFSQSQFDDLGLLWAKRRATEDNSGTIKKKLNTFQKALFSYSTTWNKRHARCACLPTRAIQLLVIRFKTRQCSWARHFQQPVQKLFLAFGKDTLERLHSIKFKHIGLAFGDGGKINKYLAV